MRNKTNADPVRRALTELRLLEEAIAALAWDSDPTRIVRTAIVAVASTGPW